MYYPFPLRDRAVASILAFGCFLLLNPTNSAWAQSFSSHDRERGLTMLRFIRDDIRKNYYDPAFRGIDLDARTKLAEEKIKLAKSNAEVFGVIAQMMLDFNDSHTVFLPPQRSARVEYGWQMQTFGDNCQVIAVKPNSDAEAKGLKPGDIVLKVDGISPNRSNLWIYHYLYTALAPRPSVRVQVQSPGEAPREMELLARIKTGKKTVDLTDTIDLNAFLREQEDEVRMNAHRFHEVGNDIVIWRMPGFDLTKDAVDDKMDKVKNRKVLILDLRRNGGGAVETLLRMIGNLFDRDVSVSVLKSRKETKSEIAKTRGDGAFKGQLLVLVDSESASAAEMLARVVQLEKRGRVIGDRTSGKVMQSRLHPHIMGVDTIIVYGASVTEADVIMSDGQSLERVGVTPDEISLPTAEDLRSKKDPVLAHAVSLAGGQLDPQEAGKLFPFKWKP